MGHLSFYTVAGKSPHNMVRHIHMSMQSQDTLENLSKLFTCLQYPRHISI